MIERIVQIGVQFALRTAFIQLLGNEYTGISGLFTDILHVLSLLELGLDSSMVFSLYEPLANHNVERVSALLRFYRKAFTLIGIFVFMSGLVCLPFLDHIVKGVPHVTEDLRGIFMMYVASSALSYFWIYKSVLLRANQESRVISKWNAFVLLAECFFEIVLLLIFRRFYAYLIVHLVATVGRNYIISGIAERLHPDFFKVSAAELSRAEKKKLIFDLACITVYNVSGVVINSTDSIFISAFVGTVEVAIISNFTLIIAGIRMGVNQIVNAAKPSIGNLAAISSTDKQVQVFNRMNFMAFWVSCVCCSCLFVLLNPFVGDIWFNNNYKISELIIGVLVANFFIAVMVYPVESFRMANGLFVQGWARPALMAVLNIVLDYFWGRKWGVFGIFIATTASRLFTQVWFDPYLVFSKVFKERVSRYYLQYILFAFVTGTSCVCAYRLSGLLEIYNTELLFLMKMIIAFTIPNFYILLLFGRHDECRYTMKILKKIFRKGSL